MTRNDARSRMTRSADGAVEVIPDTLVAQGLPQEFVNLANEKLAAINDAWDRVRKHRGLAP